MITITKDNFAQYANFREFSGIGYRDICDNFNKKRFEVFESAVKRLCKTVPEFTLQPIFDIAVEQFDGEPNPVKIFKFNSTVDYPPRLNMSCRFLPTFFCLDAKKINGEKQIQFDLKSLGIKKVTAHKITKMTGEATCYKTDDCPRYCSEAPFYYVRPKCK